MKCNKLVIVNLLWRIEETGKKAIRLRSFFTYVYVIRVSEAARLPYWNGEKPKQKKLV